MKKNLVDIECSISLVEEKLVAAAWGDISWSEALDAISSFFPGSYAYMASREATTSKVSSFVQCSSCDTMISNLYKNNFIDKSPWIAALMIQQPNKVCLSEEFFPARLAWDTHHFEFLKILPTFVANVGLRLSTSFSHDLVVCVVYPLSYSDKYELPIRQLLASISSLLKFYVELCNRAGRYGDERRAKDLLFSSSGKSSCVVNGELDILYGSENLNDLHCPAIKPRNGKLHSKNSDIFAKIRMAVFELDSSNALSKKIGFYEGGTSWIISINKMLHRTDIFNSNNKLLFHVTISSLYGEARPFNILDFSKSYLLTNSEARLCEAIASGNNLISAANVSGITYEHARQRMKIIFQKTRTSSQIELSLLLAKFQ